MKTGEVCNRTVVVVGREMPLSEAAKLMRENHVGSLVVSKNTYGRKPVGIVTDRDMVVEVLAEDLDYRTLTVGEIMGDKLVIAKETDDSLDTLKLIRASGVCRIPVVTDNTRCIRFRIETAEDLIVIINAHLNRFVK